MVQSIFGIARNTFTESIRQPIFLVVLGLGAAALVVSLFLSAYTFDNDDVILIEFCLSTIFVGGVTLAALLATGVLAREIENKTVLTVISKPISRPTFIFGKFLGVVGAVFLAFWIWSIICLMLVRHEVMSTARDKIDMPVFYFGFGALVLAVLIATWGNYFYNWVFTSRFVGILAVTISLGYVLVLLINKNWEFQPIYMEFVKELEEKRAPLIQIMIALLLVFQGLIVLCAIAIACSTRLGQLMTLLICIAVFLMGTSSDWLFGRFESVQPLAWMAYRLTPNVTYVFVADALAQRSPITGGYFGLVTGYTLAYTAAALSLAVALFQTRETG